MNMTNKKLILTSIFSICILVLSLFFFMGNITYAKTELGDGVYRVPFESESLTDMGMMAFENKKREVIIEKIGNKYYMTVSFDSANIENVELLDSVGVVGYTLKKDGRIMRYTYSISEANLNKAISFKGHIIVMDNDKEFNFIPQLNKAVKIGDVDSSKDRPAEYVPVIKVETNDNELEVGSTYIIPKATATFCNKDIKVNVNAYYIKDGQQINVEIIEDKIMLDQVGEYHVIFKAESDKYKTLLGKNTSAEIDITLTSKIGAMSLAKIKTGDTIPERTQVQANHIKEGDLFNDVKAKLSKESENFEIINVKLFDDKGNDVILSGDSILYLLANAQYDRNKIIVYHVEEDGTLEKCEANGYGRYVQVATDKVGAFVISVPGVEFIMPMWGYATITVGAVILIILAIIIPIIVAKNKNKK